MDFAADPQTHVLRAYTVLRLLRSDWGGALLLCCGLGPEGAALSMAANIAGAVCLGLEERPETVRAALRSGSCDFVVNTLDEALRAMKNEVRKRMPISVGLEGSPLAVLAELVERGVQPEMIASFPAEDRPTAEGSRDAILMLQRRGAAVVSFGSASPSFGPASPIEGEIEGSALLQAFLEERGWELQSFQFASALALRNFDAKALTFLGEDDELRRRWLRAASRIVQRQRPLRRMLWLTPAERDVLQAASPA
jgi:urocanate hydratase